MNKAPEAFRTISEVAEELELPQHVLRFWESRFPQVRPMKRGGGRRYYRPDDVDLLRGIRHLLYGEGYTIRGVQRILREQGGRFVQTVWQEGAPQPERRPELDAADHDGEEPAESTVPDAEEAEAPAALEDAAAAEPDLDTDPYGRREPSFRPLQGPPRPPALAPTGPAPIPAAVAVAPPPVMAALRDSPPPADGPADRGPAPEREAVLPGAAVPVAPPRLSVADRARLEVVLGELEACRRLLAEALAEPGPAP